jgi:hypothetical protein
VYKQYCKDESKSFYIRNSKFVLLFKHEDTKLVSELIPSIKLLNLVKELKLEYTEKVIDDEQED